MNLNTATNEQLEEYREKTASILKIDPFMLDYIWMNDPDTGLKNRVLYAKRGAAEALRQVLGISVESLVPSISPDGLLSFMATGRDKSGRQEIAVGSAYTDGLKGDKKAHALMTAQTRAVRRLTLQFVAGGVLDETEVQSQSALQGPPAASQATLAGSPAVMPPPQTAPSAQPGKDITPNPVLVDQSVNITQVYAEGATALAAMSVPKAVIPVYSDAQNPLKVGISCEVIADIPMDTSQVSVQENLTEPLTEPRKKRQYRRKNQVDIASPGQASAEQTEMPVGQIDSAGKITPISVPPATANDPEQGAIGNRIAKYPALAETSAQPLKVALPPMQPIQVALSGESDALLARMQTTEARAGMQTAFDAIPGQPIKALLSKEKQDEYRSRLSKYYNDILPRGGMQSSENIGGPTMKTRKFAAIHTGVADTKQMTETHWEDLFEFLDSNASNPKFLVDYINKALGIA